MNPSRMRKFRHDPLGFIEDLARRAPEGMFRLPWGGWCVSDADLALSVLSEPDFNSGRSAFFRDLLPSRAAQVILGRAVRHALDAYAGDYRDNMVRAVAQLPAASPWPVTGPDLVFLSTADFLLRPEADPPLRRMMHQAVHNGLLVRSPHMRRRARAEMMRLKLAEATLAHVRERRRQGRPPEPPDLLDTVLHACPAESGDRTVAELYLLLHQSIVRNVGYALAWSLLLPRLHGTSGPPWSWPTEWAVREAARCRPMVWMVGRDVPRRMEIGGVTLRAGTTLSVSPYLLHHDEQRWTDPRSFRPERWSQPHACGPYLPFSAGPFTCTAAAVAHRMTGEALDRVGGGAHLSVSGGVTHPTVTDAAVPGPFVLHRVTTSPAP
ncbi:cytochrome P450 [Streptomyces iconiensis]|uniref:Cytochrome P450 n=1 Tax=Streptomyces iconiensis TaxID=1384038 RepID=A0ABT6ZXD0_9ACTN|nr:cytochrome P450 [Streptomyces iconiensis]MDJ1133464.1 cytochrome P450 [Streptomyces iconiensis]